MHNLLWFVGGFAFCAFLIAVFGKKVEAAEQKAEQKVKADIQNAKAKVKSKAEKL